TGRARGLALAVPAVWPGWVMAGPAVAVRVPPPSQVRSWRQDLWATAAATGWCAAGAGLPPRPGTSRAGAARPAVPAGRWRTAPGPPRADPGWWPPGRRRRGPRRPGPAPLAGRTRLPPAGPAAGTPDRHGP